MDEYYSAGGADASRPTVSATLASYCAESDLYNSFVVTSKVHSVVGDYDFDTPVIYMPQSFSASSLPSLPSDDVNNVAIAAVLWALRQRFDCLSVLVNAPQVNDAPVNGRVRWNPLSSAQTEAK